MFSEQQPLSRLHMRLRGCFYHDEILRDFLDEHYFWSGHGFRGKLCIEVGSCLEVDPDIATEVALFTELLHNASLIHDDIIDRDEQRRGHMTIWRKHGISKALLLGDLLIGKAFEVALNSRVEPRIKVKWSSLLSKTVLHAVKGAIDELVFDHHTESDLLERYYRMATLKTGALFALPISCLASVAGMDANQTATLTDSFSDLAVAYQIKDDQADFHGKKLGRNITSDITNGRPNIYHLMSPLSSFSEDFESYIASYHSNLVFQATEKLTSFAPELIELVNSQVLPFVHLDESLSGNLGLNSIA